jgi:hypothetical protein
MIVSMFLASFQSLSQILCRVAYPVEPFDFKFVLNCLPPPLLDGFHERLGKEPDLLDQSEDYQANEFQYVHKAVFES